MEQASFDQWSRFLVTPAELSPCRHGRRMYRLRVDAGSAYTYKNSYNLDGTMHIVGYSAARQRLAKLMDSVVDDRRPVVVTRRRAPAVVMLALEEYEAMAETIHLLRSPKNARRLQRAIRDADARRFVRDPRA